MIESKNIKEVDQQTFENLANQFWAVPPDCYGSIQYAAQRAKNHFEDEGMDATKAYEQMRIKLGSQWYYAGD